MDTPASSAGPGTGPYVELLGEPSITLASGRLSFQRDKRYQLLAYLAYHRDWVPRERLARLFWPEHDRSDARLNLRQLLKRTRRLSWQPDLERSEHDEDLLVRWLPRTDLAELERVISLHDHEAAIRIYRGPLLTGLTAETEPEFSGWLEFERLQVHERWRDALVAHALRLGSEGDHHRAANVLAVVLRHDEFDEEVLRAYMTSSTRAGHVKRALDAYDAFAELLVAEVRLEPSTETQSLIQRIRAGDLATSHEPAGDQHGPEGNREASTPRASESKVGLPAAVPPLIGRELELSELAHLLSDPTCRLLTVTGPGGVGKTRLVLGAISELHPNYQEGAVFVPLEALPVGGSISNAIATACGLAPPGVPDPDPLERVVGALRDKNLLLVLDNIEHLDGTIEVVARLLARCPRVVVVTTSRERLSLAEEWLLPIEGLAYPADGAGLDDATAYDAVRLFVQRAQRVRPTFLLSEADVPHVIEVCRLVDGLPLGLELAAAWVRTLPCSEVAKEIARDSDFLDRSPRDAPDRHRSIRATFEYSWRRLMPAERAALRALATFQGEFDAHAARHVTAARFPVIAALVDRSLLAARGDGHFKLHPLLRKYAAEKSIDEPESMRQARARHGRYHLRLLTTTFEILGEAHLVAVSALDAAFADLAASWRWACEERLLDELGRAAAPLTTLCRGRARYAEGHDLLTEALDALGQSATGSLATARLLVHRARLAERLGRTDEARRDAESGLGLLGQGIGRPEHVTALQVLGALATRNGRYSVANEIFLRAISSAEAQGARVQVAQLSGSIGLTEQYLGRRARAAVWYRRTLKLQRDLDNPAGAVAALSNLGNVMRLLGCRERAHELLDEALELAKRVSANDPLPNLHINVGVLMLDQDQLALAAASFDSALRLARESGKRSLEVNAMFQLGRCSLLVGDARTSQERFLETLQCATDMRHREKVLDSLVGLAWVRARLGDVRRAERLLTIALAHSATSPGTTRWAHELREALALGIERASGAPGSIADGAVVMRAVDEALAGSN